MDSYQAIEVLRPLSESFELLYATDTLQVRLWDVKAGDRLENFLQAQAGETVTESQCIPVVGAVQVQSEGKTHQVERGCRFTLEGNKKHTLHAAGANVLLLELRRGTGFSAKPLKEVTEERPWGSFTVLKDEPEYKLKQLLVRPACRLSLQRHFKREEHWFITRGKPEISLDETQHRLEPGGYIHIPLQSWHRIANPVDASVPVEIIELQLGDYFGEDDIERSQDDYGRR